jgi:hypothetical protein
MEAHIGPGPTAREVVDAESMLACGGDPHEIDVAVMTLIAAGQRKQLMINMAEGRRYEFLSRTDLAAAGLQWQVDLGATIERIQAIYDADPAARQAMVQAMRDRAKSMVSRGMYLLWTGKANRLAELVTMADRWNPGGQRAWTEVGSGGGADGCCRAGSHLARLVPMAAG